MRRVRFTESVVSLVGTFRSGREVDLSEVTARSFVRRGQAVYVDPAGDASPEAGDSGRAEPEKPRKAPARRPAAEKSKE